MIFRPTDTGRFHFVAVAMLRAKQLLNGSTPRVPLETRLVITAQREVAEGKVHSNEQPLH